MNSVACAVAQRDGAGFVEQKNVHVARGFDGFAAHGQHVVLHHAVDAGDADGARAGRRWSSGSGRPAATTSTVTEKISGHLLVDISTEIVCV